jgi:hypothetical protein
MVPDSVLKSVMTAALHSGTLISFRRVLHFAHLDRLAGTNPIPEKAHVEETKEQPKERPEDRSVPVVLPEPECCRCRYRSDGDLYRCAWGSRSAAGAVFLDLYGRPARGCGLAEGVPDRDRSHGVDGSVLDSVVSDFGGARIQGLPGQRPSRKECSGTQVRCIRLPMAAVSAFGGLTARVVPAGAGGTVWCKWRRVTCNTCKRLWIR